MKLTLRANLQRTSRHLPLARLFLASALIASATLSGCVTRSGNTSAPNLAAVPSEYLVGCERYAPALRAGVLSKVNALKLAYAFNKCSKLQKDETAWIVAYLKDLGGK